MKNLINKSLKILVIIAMMISISSANKDETPVLVGESTSITILPRDYITIHSVTMGKENGDCKMSFEDIKFGNKKDKKLGEQLSWFDKGGISFYDYGEFCRPYSDENENVKYIIVLNTNFGSYVYEYIHANDTATENYVLPLIDYKKQRVV